jgi:hypothetical protein
MHRPVHSGGKADHEHLRPTLERPSDRASDPAYPMSGLGRGTVYRGTEGCLPRKELIAKPASSGRRGGTVGPGSRQATRRSHHEQLAYEFDVDGMQLAGLLASLDVYFDKRERAQLCATPHGRHLCGLILMRPPRPSCTQTLCRCDADTVTMAYRFGFGAQPKALQRWWSVNRLAREPQLKAARRSFEEGTAVAPSCTPARFQDPAASPSTTRVRATTTTDATGVATPRQPALTSEGRASASPAA